MQSQRRTSPVALIASLILAIPSAALSDIITIEGSLTEDDLVGTDSSLESFYYDLFEFEAPSTATITITLATDDFAPYFGWGLDLGLPPWPTGSDAPYDAFAFDYCESSPGTYTTRFARPTAGETFQVLVSTCAYNPTALGSYTLTIDDGVTPIPEPGTLALLGIGLVGFAALRRRR